MRFVVLLLIAFIPAAAQNNNVNRDPEAVKFVTSDIDNFWRAFDMASKEPDRAKKIQIYQTEYLDKGSAGLKDFLRLRIKNAETLVDATGKLPGFYAAARPSTVRVAHMQKQLRKSFRKFKEMYPDAVFPDVYFVIGITSTGGTTGPSGLLIGTELYSRSPQTPVDELPQWLKTVLMPIDTIPAIVAHESCHYNQSAPESKTVLGKSIQEGMCDLISELTTGKIINVAQHTYGNAHEAELWQKFQADADTEKVRDWMYNGVTSKDKPGDLGYFMGYKITKAYYEKAKDKKLAIREILSVTDFQKFLDESGYTGTSRTSK
jgi:hypothetical protein